MPTKRPRRRTFKTSPQKVEVRRSSVHGKGVYATTPIRKAERIMEYTGERMPWDDAMNLPARDRNDPHHTFFFSLENGDVIDAGRGGNDSRWINHSCDPNCETSEEDDRIFIYALRSIGPGEELFYDYKIIPAERRTKKLEQQFACLCGSAKCRGTMLESVEPKKEKKR